MHHLQQHVAQTVSAMWADSTWATYRRQYLAMLDFADRLQLQHLPLDERIVLYVGSLRATTLPATRLTYAKALAAIAGRLQQPVPVTRMYMSGLRAQGANVPTSQAPALTTLQLQRLREIMSSKRNSEGNVAALFVAWKSAARWGEVSLLTGANFIHTSEEEIIVHWGTKTKSTRSDPHRPDNFTVIHHEPSIPSAIVNTIRALGQDELLTSLSTDRVTALMKEVNPRLSAHSIKAGALNLLASAVELGYLPMDMLSLMAKHKVDDARGLSTTTIRYLRDKVQLARMLGTQKATILLGW